MGKLGANILIFIGIVQAVGAERIGGAGFRTEGVPLAVDYCVGIAFMITGFICLAIITRGES